ncbi:acyltransferase family protein [Ferrovibrio sp.]|uniref:acyltransferase family protein n=1 Tax=Ferrovibrio sp. TaxID=1917215 RepID=UPI0026085200|nr:acyltransferase family protein [Ferrovibrio sp.]
MTIPSDRETASLHARRYDLDWLRIGAFGLLIFYHIGMFFVSWDWHVKSTHAGPGDPLGLQPLMLLSNPWRLALLFLIAGCATRFMADRLDRVTMLKSRSLRLLLPLVFGMLVIVPPQTYYEIVEKLGYAEGWLAFYGKYIGFHDGWRPGGQLLIVPTWNHLWFVVYLWVYSMIVIMLRPLLMAAATRRLARQAVPWLQGAGLILLPWLLLGGLRLWLFPRFGQTHALVGDWYLHAMYLSLFLFGYAIAKADAVWAAIMRLRWVALVLALLSYAGLVWFMLQDGPLPVPLRMLRQAVWALDLWAWILMLLGFARVWLNHAGPRTDTWRRYLTEAVFPFYILHQTVIVVVGHHLAPFALPAWAEGVILVAATMLACWVGYEIIRRARWLRPWFGLANGPSSVPYMKIKVLSES